MKKELLITFLFAVILAVFPLTAYADINGKASPGWKIFDPFNTESDRGSYRYGPSIIINEDGSVDMWTASPGKYGEWDWISYRHSTDGGHTWGKETVALKPNPGSKDLYSVCDPGVVKIGQYYYLGYTSTSDNRGTDNCVFVARSKNPAGPYDKWNGNGWGGNPEPIVRFDGPRDYFGSGEPSFVVKDDVIYIYYTWCSEDSQGKSFSETRVSTASANDPNWPSKMVYKGAAIQRSIGEDSSDVKYVDDLGKFIAISSAKRFTPDSYINAWESKDGINFTPADFLKDNIQTCCHNAGISGRANGHIKLSDKNFIAYAYGSVWAGWSTFLNPITIEENNGPAEPEIYNASGENGQATLYFEEIQGVKYKIKYGTSKGSYTDVIDNIKDSPYTVKHLKNGTTYYFTVTAYNEKEESKGISEVSSTPLDYSISPIKNVSASSELPGYETSKAIDSSISSYWSSVSHQSGNFTEYITLDTGAERNIAKVILTPRQKEEWCYPDGKNILIEVSNDGIVWKLADVTVDKIYLLYSDVSKYIYYLNKPIYGRYVRIFTDKLTADNHNNYCVQLADIQIQDLGLQPTEPADAKYPINFITDQCVWINGSSNTAQINIKALMNDGNSIDISKASSGVKYSGYDENIIQVNTDGQITASQNGSTVITITYMDKSINLPVFVTSMAGKGVDKSKWIVKASSSLTDQFGPYNTIDNGLGSPWLSQDHNTSDAQEWISYDFGTELVVNNIVLYPRYDSHGVNFPSDFLLQYSSDGVVWTDIPEQSYKDYQKIGYDGNEKQIFVLSNPLTTRYIRVLATKLTGENGVYRCTFSEFNINENTQGYGNEVLIQSMNPILNIPLNTSNPVKFKIVSFYDGGYLTEITNSSDVVYTGYDESIIKLNSDYSITPLKEGNTEITVTYKGMTAKIEVNVDSRFIDKVLITPEALSVVIPQLGAENAVDNNADTFWSSQMYTNPNAEEWISLKFESDTVVNGVTVVPRRPGALCFPINFKFQYSNDGQNWNDIDGQNYTDYKNPGDCTLTFKFNNSVTAKYIRMLATKLSTDNYGNYYFQLGEFNILRENAVLSITPKQSDIVMEVDGDIKQIENDVLLDNGYTECIANTSDGVSYSGYDKKIININENGVITAVKKGTTEVIISYKGKTSAVRIIVDKIKENKNDWLK